MINREEIDKLVSHSDRLVDGLESSRDRSGESGERSISAGDDWDDWG
jgi:hypothetical protein